MPTSEASALAVPPPRTREQQRAYLDAKFGEWEHDVRPRLAEIDRKTNECRDQANMLLDRALATLSADDAALVRKVLL